MSASWTLFFFFPPQTDYIAYNRIQHCAKVLCKPSFLYIFLASSQTSLSFLKWFEHWFSGLSDSLSN